MSIGMLRYIVVVWLGCGLLDVLPLVDTVLK